MSARTPWLCLSEAVGLEVNGVRLWLSINLASEDPRVWIWEVTDLSDGKMLSTGSTPKHKNARRSALRAAKRDGWLISLVRGMKAAPEAKGS